MLFLIVMGTLKLTKNSRHGLSHHIRQYVQPSPMRHTNNKTVRTQLRRPINRILHRRDDGFAAIQAESFRGIEFVGEKALEGVGEA